MNTTIRLYTKHFDDQYIIKIKQIRGRHEDELLGQYYREREEWLKAFYGYRTLFDALDFEIIEEIDDRCRKELNEEIDALYLD